MLCENEVIKFIKSSALFSKMQDLKERLAELGEKYPLTQRLKQYAQGTYTRELHFRTIERYGYSNGLVPIVLSDDKGVIEDLGEEGFWQGKQIENYVGRVFRKRRKELGLSWPLLTHELGKSEGWLSECETGRHLPSIELLERICRTLNLNWAYLAEPQAAGIPLPAHEPLTVPKP